MYYIEAKCIKYGLHFLFGVDESIAILAIIFPIAFIHGYQISIMSDIGGTKKWLKNWISPNIRNGNRIKSILRNEKTST